LAGIYEWQDKNKQALSTWEMAYKQGLMNTKQDIQLLAQLLLRLKYPLKSANVLQTFYDTFNENVLNERLLASDYELLAQAWNEAKEHELAIDAYLSAFDVSKLPKYAVAAGQMYLERQQNQNAYTLLNKVTKNQTGEYYLLLGYVLVQLDNNEQAIKAYKQALNFEKSSQPAQEWLDYLTLVQANN